MIARFFKFLALLWYADEYGWPDAPISEGRCPNCGRRLNPTPAPRLAGTSEASTIGDEAEKIVATLRPND